MDTQPLIDAISTGQISLAVLVWVVVRVEQLMYRSRVLERRIERLEATEAGRVQNDVRGNAEGIGAVE
jgi:hypothetical protein